MAAFQAFGRGRFWVFANINTGIFTERQVVNPPNKKELQSISEWYKKRGSLQGQIAYNEENAKRILKKHRIADPDLTVVLKKIMEAMQRKPEEVVDCGAAWHKA